MGPLAGGGALAGSCLNRREVCARLLERAQRIAGSLGLRCTDPAAISGSLPLMLTLYTCNTACALHGSTCICIVRADQCWVIGPDLIEQIWFPLSNIQQYYPNNSC